MGAGYPMHAWPPYLNITSIPSVVLEENTSRNQAWKCRVIPGCNTKSLGRFVRSGEKLNVPPEPELRI